MIDVPYIVYESEMTRLERIIKRQFVLIIVTLCFLIGTNGIWLWYESQFQEVVTTNEVTQDVTQENDNGNNNFVGGDGGITNGEAEGEADSQNDNKDTQEKNRR